MRSWRFAHVSIDACRWAVAAAGRCRAATPAAAGAAAGSDPLSQQLRAILAPASQHVTAKARLVASGALLHRHARTLNSVVPVHPTIALEMVRLLTHYREDGALSWLLSSLSPAESHLTGGDGRQWAVVEGMLLALRELVAFPASALLVGEHALRLALGALMLRDVAAACAACDSAACKAHVEHIVAASIGMSLRQGSVLKFVPTADELLQIAAIAYGDKQQATTLERDQTPYFMMLLRLAYRVDTGDGAPRPLRLVDALAATEDDSGWRTFVGEHLLFPRRPSTHNDVWRTPSFIADLHRHMIQGTVGGIEQLPPPPNCLLRVPLPIPDDVRMRQVLMQLAQLEHGGPLLVLVDVVLLPLPAAAASTIDGSKHGECLQMLLPFKAWLEVALGPNAPASRVQLSFASIVTVVRHCLAQLQAMNEDEPKCLLAQKPRIHALKETVALVQQCTTKGAAVFFPDEDPRGMEQVLRDLGHRARHFVRRVMALKAAAVREDGVLGALLAGGVERSDLEADAMLRNAAFRVIEPVVKRMYMCWHQYRWWSGLDDALAEIHQHAGTQVHASEVFTLRHPLQCSQIALVETWRTVALKTMAQLIADIRKRMPHDPPLADPSGVRLGAPVPAGHASASTATEAWLQTALLLDGAVDALLQRLQDDADATPSDHIAQSCRRISLSVHRTIGLLLVHIGLLFAVGRDNVRWPSDPWPVCRQMAERAMERGAQLGDPCEANVEATFKLEPAPDDEGTASHMDASGGGSCGLHWMDNAAMRAWTWAQHVGCTQSDLRAVRRGLVRGFEPTSHSQVVATGEAGAALEVVTAGSYEARLRLDASFSGVSILAVPWSAGASASQPLRFYDEDGSSQQASEQFEFFITKVNEATAARAHAMCEELGELEDSDGSSGSSKYNGLLCVAPLSLMDELALLMS